MDIAKIGAEFPGTQDKTFLDAACVGLTPTRAKQRMLSFIENTMMCPEESASHHHIAMDQQRVRAYEEAAVLLNADTEEVALVESTSHGLNIAATAMRLPRGSNILTPDLEFLQVNIPWCMQEGIEVRVLPTREGRVLADDFERAIDSNTKAIVMSSVQWCNGYKACLEEFGKLAQKYGLYFVVDAVQHLGACRLDVKKVHVDFLTAGGHKWLNSPFGTGILYVNKALVGKLEPVFWGYLNLEEPNGGWATYFGTPSISPVSDWRFVNRAKRFEIGGTSNYLGTIALAQCLSLVNELGIKNIEQHIFQLTEYLISGLCGIGAHVVTPLDPEARSGIVSFRFYDSLEEDERLFQSLLKNRIYLSMRFTSNVGGIRVSCHFYNDNKDIDRLLDELKKAAAVKKPDYSR